MKVTLRPILSSDMHKILEWRNKKDNRKWFFNSQILTTKDQEKWFSAYVDKSDDVMFIIYVDSVAIGTIAIYNIDKEKKEAEIGRLLIGEEKYRLQGYAYEAGRLLLEYAFNSLELESLYLNVFADNVPAINLYDKLGFREMKKLMIKKRG